MLYMRLSSWNRGEQGGLSSFIRQLDGTDKRLQFEHEGSRY